MNRQHIADTAPREIRGWRNKMKNANFNFVANELVKSAATPKAADFANKVIGQIESRGDEWIEANIDVLGLKHFNIACNSVAPVADNRIFWMTKFQIALR